MDEITSDPQEPMSVKRLIAFTKGDRTYDDLERLSGGVMSAKRLQQIGTDRPILAFPDPQSIPGLAAAFGVTERGILDAYCVSLNVALPRPQSLLMQMFPPGTELLSEDDVRHIRWIITRLIQAERDRRPAEDDDETTPEATVQPLRRRART